MAVSGGRSSSVRSHYAEPQESITHPDSWQSQSGLPDFSWYKIPKWGKYTKWPQNIPNGHKTFPMTVKLDQMVIKHAKIFHCKTLQNLPKLVFVVWKQTIWQPCSARKNDDKKGTEGSNCLNGSHIDYCLPFLSACSSYPCLFPTNSWVVACRSRW
jgi:hypothetical protein